MSLSLFDHPQPVIAALHPPDFTFNRRLSVARYAECALADAWVVAEAGMHLIKPHDQTKTGGQAAPDTLAPVAALGRLIRDGLPRLGLGIIIGSALMQRDAGPEGLLRRDVDLCLRFMDAVRVPA